MSSDQVDGENKDDEGNQKPRYRPNRISSTPDIVAPIQSLYDSDTTLYSPPSSSPPSIASTGASGLIFPYPPVPKSSCSSSSSSGEDDKEREPTKQKVDAEDGNKLRSLAKRLSSISSWSLTTNEKVKDDRQADERRSGCISHSSSTTSLASSSSSRTVLTHKTSQTAPPIPTIPPWALNSMREEAGIANRNMKYGHRRASDEAIASPSQQIPRTVRPSTSGSPSKPFPSSTQPFPTSAERDPFDDWMSGVGSAPRFSRLGLGGNGIVLPVKKRESLPVMKSTGSVTVSRSAGARNDSGVTNEIESSPEMDLNDDSNDIDADLLEKGSIRKRDFVAKSLKSKTHRVSISSLPGSLPGSENVPPLPPAINKSDFPPAPVMPPRMSSSTPRRDSAPKILKTSASLPIVASINPTRRSATLKRDNVFAAIDENRLPPSLSNDTPTEFERKEAQKAKMKRKSIKQIVMRITTAPMSAGEKLKLTMARNSMSTVVLPPDPLAPLDPPRSTRFEKLASSSVPSLPFTKEVPEFGGSQSDVRSGKRFKGVRKRWNALFSTSRG